MRIAGLLALLLPALAAAQEAPPPRPAAPPMRQIDAGEQRDAARRHAAGYRGRGGPHPAAQPRRRLGLRRRPRVVEVRPASPTSLFLFGVAPGRTTIAAIDGQGAPVAQYEVTVRPSGFGAGEAQSTISRLLPGNRIRTEQRGNGIALHGEVATAAEADQATNIARGYLAEGQQVDNRLSVLGQVQVNLRVRIAEVSREVTRQLGVDWQAVGRSGNFALSLLTRNALFDAINPSSTIAAGWSDGKSDINGIIDALAQDRLITVLAEPNLTAMSGETASFLVGGEFPIPVGAARQRRHRAVQAVRRQPGLRADGDVAGPHQPEGARPRSAS